ncbi:hypothetical protein [Paenibacillus sp. OV219]|nr:hypothetical protein [Paenibacillus sp. OV219]
MDENRKRTLKLIEKWMRDEELRIEQEKEQQAPANKKANQNNQQPPGEPD